MYFIHKVKSAPLSWLRSSLFTKSVIFVMTICLSYPITKHLEGYIVLNMKMEIG